MQNPNPVTVAMIAGQILAASYDLKEKDSGIVSGDSRYRASALQYSAELALDLVLAVEKEIERYNG